MPCPVLRRETKCTEKDCRYSHNPLTTYNVHPLDCGDVYVLRLTGDWLYVGFSGITAESRIFRHFRGDGARLTAEFPPIQIVEIIRDVSMRMENITTWKYASQYGVNKVRGGNWATKSSRPSLNDIAEAGFPVDTQDLASIATELDKSFKTHGLPALEALIRRGGKRKVDHSKRGSTFDEEGRRSSKKLCRRGPALQ